MYVKLLMGAYKNSLINYVKSTVFFLRFLELLYMEWMARTPGREGAYGTRKAGEQKTSVINKYTTGNNNN